MGIGGCLRGKLSPGGYLLESVLAGETCLGGNDFRFCTKQNVVIKVNHQAFTVTVPWASVPLASVGANE